MASFISRILSKFRKQQNDVGRSRRERTRKLRLEHMEHRCLMAGDMATIGGNVFTDLTDNGLTVDDTDLASVTVRLYRDSAGTPGVGTFDSAVDTLIGAPQVTNSAGDYLFENLGPGRYFVQQAAAVGRVQRPSETVKIVDISNGQSLGVEALVIDSLDTVTSPDPLSAAAGATAMDQVTTGVGEALGGERDVVVDNDAGSASTIQFDVNPVTGVVLIDAGNSTTGSVVLTYDGVDASADTIDHTTLGGVDLTDNDGAAFYFRVGSQVGSTMTIDVFSSATTFSSRTVTLPTTVGGGPDEDMFIRFADFAIGVGAAGVADFSAVTAIRIEVNLAAADDVGIDFVSIVAPTPFTQNFANLNPLSIGDRVWRDTDNDGTLDVGESGIENVLVQVYEDNGTTAGVFDAGDTFIDSDTTDATGNYLISNLLPGTAASPGSYLVVIPSSNFTGGGALVGHTASTTVQAPNADSNNVNKGTMVTAGFGIGAAVTTAALTLSAGGEPTNDGDTDNNTNRSLDFGFVAPPPVLTITKDDSPDIARVGENLTYTITVRNDSPSGSGRDSTVTTITDTLPTGLTLVGTPSFTISNPTGAGGNATFDTNTRVISANVGTLVPGQSATLVVVATVGATFANPTPNTANASNAQGSTVTPVTINTPAAPNVDLGISKTIVGGGTTVPLGGTLTYRLTITNNTNVAVTGVVVNDDLPAGFVPGTLPTGVAAGTAPADLVWSVGNLSANGTATVDIPVNVPSTVTPGNYTNTASIVTTGMSFTDLVLPNNNSSVGVTVEPRYDLLVTKTNNLTSVATGQTITYTIEVDNDGPSPATNVQVTDTLPAQLQFISATSGGNPIGTINGQAFSATLPSVASNATTSILVVARVLPSATGSVTNTVNITADNPNQEIAGRANSATDTDPVTRQVVLAISKDDSADPVIAGGGTFQYTVTAFNSGTADAPNVLFSDPLPTGIEFVSGTFSINETVQRTGSVTFNQATNRLEANLGTLLAGGSATVNRALITLNVRATANASGTVTNTATLTSPDTIGAGVTDSETTLINRQFDLTVSKQDNAEVVTRGQEITYTIIVSNEGPSTATNVLVTDTLPSNLTFVSASNGFTHNSGTVSGTIATLEPGTTGAQTITIVARVNNDAPAGATINNAVTVSAAGETGTLTNTANAVATVATNANISGFTYVDKNNNNTRDTTDAPLSGVVVNLTGTATGGTAINRSATTDSTGAYSFADVPFGTYVVTQVQPDLFASKVTNVGTINNVTVGTGTVNTISAINLNGDSINNNFGEMVDYSLRWCLPDAPDLADFV